MTDPHRCHAFGCSVTVPRRMFMCRRHWFMVPKADRDLVWALYTPGQENDWTKVTPLYLSVTMRIVQELAERENVPPPCGGDVRH